MSKTVVIWPYRFKTMGESWKQQMLWVCKALQARGYAICTHPKFETKIPGAVPYDGKAEKEIVIYNHALGRDVVKYDPEAKAKHTWFFKPTIPDELHTTLDSWGYGAYMKCTYVKPPFKQSKAAEVKKFYAKQIKEWIAAGSCKWGKFDHTDVPDDDYYLVIGQVPTDTVVTTMNFGKYDQALFAIVDELNHLTKRRIIVKLHPRAAGKAECQERNKILRNALGQLGVRVCVEDRPVSVHSYFPKARAVITCNSEAGIEAMFHDKPVISWGYPQYHWVTYDLRHLCDLERALRLDWFNKKAARQWVYWYLRRFAFWDMKSAQRRVDELLEETYADA